MQSMRLRALAGALVIAGAISAVGCRSLGRPSATAGVVRGADGIADAVAAADVVFVGEYHDDPAHHGYQLELLKELTDAAERENAPALFGMEMFQRPFQRHLDDYVAGHIDEREMLRRTEYIDRWQFDFTLYAPLWRFCRERGVRIVALNAEASIVSAVGRNGIAGLTATQRAQIAADIDLDVPLHRERVMGVFQGGAHPMPEDALQSMYEAMTVWDETMAETAAAALTAAGPGARMLVIAGSQHVQEFSGIPDRMARRMPGLRGVVVALRTQVPESPADGAETTAATETAPDEAAGDPAPATAEQQPGDDGDGDDDEVVAAPQPRVEVEGDLGDFVVWLRPVDVPPRRLMGVMLAIDPLPGGLLVESVVDDSNAARAGLQAGDVIHRVDGLPITDMVDVRHVLGLTPIGATVLVQVLRGGRRVDLPLTFRPPAPHPGA